MFYEHAYPEEKPLVWCVLCGHPHAQKHRIKPKVWGGDYTEGNVVMLCPNHHVAVHFLMAWYLDAVRKRAQRSGAARDDGRLMEYMADRPLWKLWGMTIKPVVRERLKHEGFWYPYIRSPDLPPLKRRKIPRIGRTSSRRTINNEPSPDE